MHQPDPLAYFITFRGYGMKLHGEQGGVDRARRRFGEKGTPISPGLRAARAAAMSQPPMTFRCAARLSVMDAVDTTCQFRDWPLVALHVRETDLHAVIRADGESPERVMNDSKSYAARRLRRDGLVEASRKVWSRHGSTNHLSEEDAVHRAVRYVVLEQGAWSDPGPGWDRALLSAESVARRSDAERADSLTVAVLHRKAA